MTIIIALLSEWPGHGPGCSEVTTSVTQSLPSLHCVYLNFSFLAFSCGRLVDQLECDEARPVLSVLSIKKIRTQRHPSSGQAITSRETEPCGLNCSGVVSPVVSGEAGGGGATQ